MCENINHSPALNVDVVMTLMLQMSTVVERDAGGRIDGDVTGNPGDKWKLWSRVRRGVADAASNERCTNTTQDPAWSPAESTRPWPCTGDITRVWLDVRRLCTWLQAAGAWPYTLIYVGPTSLDANLHLSKLISFQCLRLYVELWMSKFDLLKHTEVMTTSSSAPTCRNMFYVIVEFDVPLDTL